MKKLYIIIYLLLKIENIPGEGIILNFKNIALIKIILFFLYIFIWDFKRLYFIFLCSLYILISHFKRLPLYFFLCALALAQLPPIP